MIRVYFAVPAMEQHGGGGMKFLNALYRALARSGQIASRPEDATVFLCNSHHDYRRVIRLKEKFPGIPLVHRIDGPIVDYNTPTDPRHFSANALDELYADGVIFQSAWSYRRNMELGLAPPEQYEIIHNAPDPDLFFPGDALPLSGETPFRVFCSSWSRNVNKGFASLERLDGTLDFSRYEINFYGRLPGKLKNIKVHPPVPHEDVPQALRGHHAFFFPSKVECCSNALLEALHCRLPVVAFNGSSNPELVGNGGLLFDDDAQLPQMFDTLRSHYHRYRSGIRCLSFGEVVERYRNFMQSVTVADCGGFWSRKKRKAFFLLRVVKAGLRHKVSGR
jgi:glycosyltransferase involved in cell wall biosynthesis